MARSVLAVWLLSGLACGVCVAPVQAAGLTVADWTSINTSTNVAVGTLGSVTVILSGDDIYSGITDESFTRFNRSFFVPALINSDVVAFLGPNPPSTFSYTISFSSAVNNPRIHLSSLASTLDFGGITLIRVSGQGDFTVSGSTVTGALHDGVPPPNDSNGTIELVGTFSEFTFTAKALGTFSGGGDGIHIQMGADVSFVQDSDGDGIPDLVDACAGSNRTPTIVIDSCDSGVTNTLLPSGCTISDLIAACAESARNHGQFVTCVSQLTNELKKAETIASQQVGAIKSCAARAHKP